MRGQADVSCMDGWQRKQRHPLSFWDLFILGTTDAFLPQINNSHKILTVTELQGCPMPTRPERTQAILEQVCWLQDFGLLTSEQVDLSPSHGSPSHGCWLKCAAVVTDSTDTSQQSRHTRVMLCQRPLPKSHRDRVEEASSTQWVSVRNHKAGWGTFLIANRPFS